MSPEPVMVELGCQSRPDSALDALSYTPSSPLGLGHHLLTTCSLNMDKDNWDEDNGKGECTCGQRRAGGGPRGPSGLEEGLEFHDKRELRPVLPPYRGGDCSPGLLNWSSKGERQEGLMNSHLEELPGP
uniref:Uncharacterized protein n=1 Tax=Aotus nancymaae TaxID=37293 RepID=A0A2K5CZE6_AOTNA